MDFESFVLAATTADLGDEPTAREHADAIEFRMDMTARPLDALAGYDGELPVIATNRRAAEGGDAPDGRDRLAVLERAADHHAVAAVDVELAALPEADRLAERAHERDAAVIVSAHEFDTTPPRGRMAETLRRAGDHGDVAKLAVTAAAPGDVLDVLSVTHELDAAGHSVATMAMGTAGRHSRAVAPLYGSRIAYAPVDADAATAPGQYDLATLAELLAALR